EKDRVVDKFIGMRYPLSRDYNIYVVRWMENIRYCLRHGIGLLQPGQTGYGLKLRLGSRLVPSAIYFRHRLRLAHAILKFLALFLAFDRLDPELNALRKRSEKP